MKSRFLSLFLLLLAGTVPIQAASALPGNGRLHRLPVVKFSFIAVDKIWIHQGVLDIRYLNPLFDGSGEAIDKPADWPDAAYDQVLIPLQDWDTYQRLGEPATANFTLVGPELTLLGERYRAVTFAETTDNLNGTTANLAMRARTGPGEDAATAGFVVTDRPAGLLIRAVGPGLADKGVAGTLPNPFLTLFEAGVGLRYNDDWSNHPDASAIATIAAAVGAFPLEPGSHDAALLVQLPPGAYTVQAEGLGQTEGVVLIEVYQVPGHLMPAQ